eukprot:scaffold212325_cov20-Prasinocladus_malaysianus.AAC.1
MSVMDMGDCLQAFMTHRWHSHPSELSLLFPFLPTAHHVPQIHERVLVRVLVGEETTLYRYKHSREPAPYHAIVHKSITRTRTRTKK